MRSVLTVLLLLLVLAPPAGAHEHPGGSIDRVTPGTVRVEAAAKVDITLFDDRAALKQIRRTYEVPLGVGTGFTVSPDGVIVTAAQVVRSDRDPAVFAANKIFAEYFKQNIPADFERHAAPNGDLDFRLQRCYPPQRTDSTCNAEVTPVVKVFPYTVPALTEGLTASVLKSGTAANSPAILKVAKGRGTLPTVPLATTFGAVKAADIVAFKGRPATTVTPAVEIAHFEPPGSQQLLKDDVDKVTKLVGLGGVGGAVVDDAKSEVVAVISGTGTSLGFATAQDIQAMLSDAGESAHRGPVDVVYETALAHYHETAYTAAVPVLQQVLKQRPDHAVAIEYLRNAQAWKGTSKEKPKAASQDVGPADSGLFNLWTIGAAAVLVLALGAGFFALRRPKAETAGLMGDAPLTMVDRTDPSVRPPTHLAGASDPGRPVWGTGAVPREPGPGDRPEFCTQCGMKRGPAHRFCGFCGHPAE